MLANEMERSMKEQPDTQGSSSTNSNKRSSSEIEDGKTESDDGLEVGVKGNTLHEQNEEDMQIDEVEKL